MRYREGEHQYRPSEMRRMIWMMTPGLWLNEKRFGRGIDILVTHAPPLGIHDGQDLCHTGFQAFLDFMDRWEPLYLVHGHTHLYRQDAIRSTQYKNTTVLEHVWLPGNRDSTGCIGCQGVCLAYSQPQSGSQVGAGLALAICWCCTDSRYSGTAIVLNQNELKRAAARRCRRDGPSGYGCGLGQRLDLSLRDIAPGREAPAGYAASILWRSPHRKRRPN